MLIVQAAWNLCPFGGVAHQTVERELEDVKKRIEKARKDAEAAKEHEENIKRGCAETSTSCACRGRGRPLTEQILELTKTASATDIKAAYRRLVRRRLDGLR